MNCFAGLDEPDVAYVSVRSKLIETEDGEIDRPTRNRRKTDKNFVYVMAIFFVILSIMLIYCDVTANKDNGNRKRRDIMDVMDFRMDRMINHLLIMMAVTVGIILATIVLMRYFIGVFIWTMLVVACLAAILVSGLLWYGFIQAKDNTHGLIIFPIIATVVTGVIILLIYATRKRIQMIIQVFKEASKAIGAMPQLFVQPSISFVIFTLYGSLGSFLVYILVQAASKGKSGPDDIVVCTFVFLSWGGIWLTYFVKGCQEMVIGGTVATWYFRRDKSYLRSPMWTSTKNLWLYHLGTVAFGSFLMLLMEIIQTIVDFFTKRKIIASCCCCCCSCLCCILKNYFKYFKSLMKYFTKMAYIMTAIHGVPFCTGCKEAIHLLVEQAFSLMQLKCFCKFVLGILQLLIVVTVVAIGKAILPDDLGTVDTTLVFVGVFTFYVANAFLTLYNVAIDTIFLCYCEDIAENDGVARPYFMSRELMCFMQDSMKTLSSVISDMLGNNQPPPVEPQLGPI